MQDIHKISQINLNSKYCITNVSCRLQLHKNTHFTYYFGNGVKMQHPLFKKILKHINFCINVNIVCFSSLVSYCNDTRLMIIYNMSLFF